MGRRKMLAAERLRPDALAPADRDAWTSLCAPAGPFANPLLSPDFAEAVGRVRADAAVAVLRPEHGPAAFLAHHRRPTGFARPVGAPFGDLHALVSGPAPGFTAPEALSAARLSSYRYGGLVDPHELFGGGGETVESFRIALADGAAAGTDHLEALRAASPKRFKNWRRLERRLGEAAGPLELVGDDHDRGALIQLLDWKREQLRRTGRHDFLATDWTQALLFDLFGRRDGAFRGQLVTLRASGHLVAGHFGVRRGPVFHPWIAANDPVWNDFSPGQAFLMQAIEAMPALGLRTYELGPGHEHYKRPFTTEPLRLGVGQASAASASGAVAAAGEGAWALAERGGPLVGRMRRRLDFIASVELSLSGRVNGLMQAVADQRRREPQAAEA